MSPNSDSVASECLWDAVVTGRGCMVDLLFLVSLVYTCVVRMCIVARHTHALQAHVHHNQPFDESLDVADAEEVASLYTPTPRVTRPEAGTTWTG